MFSNNGAHIKNLSLEKDYMDSWNISFNFIICLQYDFQKMNAIVLLSLIFFMTRESYFSPKTKFLIKIFFKLYKW